LPQDILVAVDMNASGGVSKLSLIETEEKFIVDIKQYLKENYE